MKVALDTSSLLSLVRYYLPFDNDSALYDFFKNKVELGEFLILDSVAEECRYLAKGLVSESLLYIKERDNQVSTKLLFPNKKFMNLLDNNFINRVVKNELSEIEFETRKSAFLNSADAKLILCALDYIKKEDDVLIVTEETKSNNDNKGFKKIPTICQILEIKVLTLPQLLETYRDIDINITKRNHLD